MNPQLSPERLDALAAELDALRAEVLADLGERDAAYIRGVVRLARTSAIAGRGLLMFGITPVSWLAGTSALGLAKILDGVSRHLAPFWEELALEPDLDGIPALWGDREALWRHVAAADFLSVDEKRALLGWAPRARGEGDVP